MSNNDIIITGIPRSGTTLVCSLLEKLPDFVALVEPMDVSALIAESTLDGRIAYIDEFFSEVRRVASRENQLPRRLSTSDTDTFAAQAAGSYRIPIIQNAHWEPVEKKLSDNFRLAVKHPNIFSAMLPGLAKRYNCFATIRDPISVILSWSNLDHPLREGHAPVAEKVDKNLAKELQNISGSVDRQVHLLNWYYDGFVRALEPFRIIRYEDVVRTGGNCLSVIAEKATFLHEGLENRNVSRDRGSAIQNEIRTKLLEYGGHSALNFYSI